jgi:hypothetical protein
MARPTVRKPQRSTTRRNTAGNRAGNRAGKGRRTRSDNAPRAGASASSPGRWTFLTNHSHVLICLLLDPTARLREVADRVGITERAVQKIVLDLVEADVLSRSREGRRNRYRVHLDRPLRHPVEAHGTVRDLVALIVGEQNAPS